MIEINMKSQGKFGCSNISRYDLALALTCNNDDLKRSFILAAKLRRVSTIITSDDLFNNLGLLWRSVHTTQPFTLQP